MFLTLEVYEIQRIISAGADMGVWNEKDFGCWGLNLPDFKG
jgi:hypothetical protein